MLNVEKCKYMHFHPYQRRFVDFGQISLQGVELQRVASYKYLGLHLDEHLTFVAHVEHLLRALRPIVGILFKVRDLVPRAMLLQLYHALIGSKFDYMIEIWGSTSWSYLRPLQVLQNQAMRNMFHLDALTPRVQIYHEFVSPILPLPGLHAMNVVKYVFKTVNSLQESNITFELATTSARRAGVLAKPHARTRFGQRRISFLGPTLFNSLPDAAKFCVSLDGFVRLIRGHFSSLPALRGFLNY